MKLFYPVIDGIKRCTKCDNSISITFFFRKGYKADGNGTTGEDFIKTLMEVYKTNKIIGNVVAYNYQFDLHS